MSEPQKISMESISIIDEVYYVIKIIIAEYFKSLVLLLLWLGI